MKRKRICFVVTSPFFAKVYLSNHIKVLNSNYEVYIVADFKTEDYEMFIDLPLKELKKIQISRGINLKKDFIALFELYKYFNTMKFDLVHTATPKAGLLGVLAARLAGVKRRIHIFTGQVWHTREGLFKKILILLDRLIVMNATDILVDGEAQRKYLINKGILREHNSFVLGRGSISGVDINRFVPNEELKNKVRKELGIKKEELVYMFLGRITIDKGIMELVEAFNKLKLSYSNIRLLVVGKDEENLIPWILNNVLNKNSVIIAEQTNKPERVLQACDVFCLPSHREGFGTGIIEASLMAKPVICSDTYGLMETIVDNKTGLRHKVGEMESIYLKMECLVENEEKRKLLGKAGREYVLSNFSAELISEKWLNFYKQII